MKRSSRMTIQQATQNYERWLAGILEIVPEDLAAKHKEMAGAIFPFLRATYYRWAQLFPHVCKDLGRAPQVLAVGDLHVENFGTWRDEEGRLVWGINDFDETWRLPYVHDLVRLATSAHLALDDGHLKINAREACESILGGYREGLEANGRPFVLAEHSKSLREMATARLKEPQKFWDKLDAVPTWKGDVPARVVKAISNLLPKPDLPRRIVHRVAGRGSLGRQRFVAIADWKGGRIAREAKALAPSAAVWAFGGEGQTKVLYQNILDHSVRCVDPWVKVRRRWIVRRLAPDCARIDLEDLPDEREETRLLRAMGWETANVHLGSRSAHALLVDLAARQGDWLHAAAKAMLAAVAEDWEAWRRHPIEPEAAVAAKALAAVPPLEPAAGKDEGPAARVSPPGKKGRAEKVRAGGGKAAVAVGKGGKAGKTVTAAKAEKPAKAAKAEKSDKGGRKGKGDKGKKAAKSKSKSKSAKVGKGDKGGKDEKAGKAQKSGEGVRRAAAAGGEAPARAAAATRRKRARKSVKKSATSKTRRGGAKRAKGSGSAGGGAGSAGGAGIAGAGGAGSAGSASGAGSARGAESAQGAVAESAVAESARGAEAAPTTEPVKAAENPAAAAGAV
jgi:Uncharacterized protein conserved in bacteria (DUF2252)